jgi:excisionase family DNA binding protein
MDDDNTQPDELLTPLEVARTLGVTPKTVSRWASAGAFPCVRTRGGHRRFRLDDVERALAAKRYEN